METAKIKQDLEKILQHLAQTAEEVNALLKAIENQESDNIVLHVDPQFRNQGIDVDSIIV